MARLALHVEKARAECVARKVKRVQEAGEKSWQADAWWLERNLPNLYGRNQRIEIESRSISLSAPLPASLGVPRYTPVQVFARTRRSAAHEIP